jgi:hypothetical protein
MSNSDGSDSCLRVAHQAFATSVGLAHQPLPFANSGFLYRSELGPWAQISQYAWCAKPMNTHTRQSLTSSLVWLS